MARRGAGDRCIMCGEFKPGLDVKVDGIILAVRWVKRAVLHAETGYHLVVCKECYPRFHKERQAYEGRRLRYVVLGALLGAVLILVSGNKLVAMLYGIGVVVFLYALSFLTYTPAVVYPKTHGKATSGNR